MSLRSIQFRLISWYTLLAIAVALIFMGCTWHSLKRYLYSNAEATLLHRAEQIDANILKSQTAASLQTIGPRIEAVYSPEANSRFIRIRRTNSILYTSGVPENRLFNPATVPVPTRMKMVLREDKQAGLLLVEYRTVIAGEMGAIDMGMPIAELDSVMDRLLAILLVALPLSIVVMVAGGYLLIKRALRPVDRLRQQAALITFGNVSNRLPVPKTGDELEVLAITLNQMLERLDSAYQQASRFSADASHELRTPLAIMRGELESLLHEEGSLAAMRDRIGSILEESESLTRIVESLFSLARMDAGEAMGEPSSFDLAELARSTVEQMALLAEEKSLSVMLDAPQPVFVRGDATRIRQVIVNLYDNAIKYTHANGRITLSVAAVSSRARLTVTDNGPGIAEDALPHVFERFYRADRSRAVHGAGLGLSIVQTICRAHSGKARIYSGDDGGTRVEVELPLSGPTREA